MVAMKQIITVGFLVSLFLLGCGRPPVKWVGIWEGQDNKVVRPGALEDDIAYSLRKVSLTIRSDATFELIRGGIPYTGNVSFGDDRCFLKVLQVLDRRVEQVDPTADSRSWEIRLEMQKDGTATLVDAHSLTSDTVVLKKLPPADQETRN